LTDAVLAWLHGTRPPGGASLMYDLAAIAIGLACFAVAFAILYTLEKI
jgi:hypothetical protein